MTSSPVTDTRVFDRRAYAIGLASGAFVMTGFGTLWALAAVGILLLPAIEGLLSFVGVEFAAAVLTISCFALLRAARRLPQDISPERRAQSAAVGRGIGRRFGIIFGIEFVAIALANIICSLLNHSEFAIPLTVLIVGLHFLPLAALFRVWQYYLTGILLGLIALLTVIIVPVTMTLGQGQAWDILPALGSSLVLWLTAVSVLLMGSNVVRSKQKEGQGMLY